MGKKATAFLLALLITLQPVNFAWAAEARILSDAELDDIHAGGLNMDFDKVFGILNNTTASMTNGASATNALSTNNATIVFTNNTKFEIKTPTAPAAVKAPTAPTSVITDPVVSSAEPLMTPLTQTATPLISTEQSAAPVETLAALAAPPVSPVTEPAAPVAPVQPQAVVMDVIASKSGGKNTDLTVALTGPVNAVLSPDAPTGPATVNSVEITDLSQQNLQAMVNVNAAGSVVPVQVNFGVLVDSSVENFEFSNQLALNDLLATTAANAVNTVKVADTAQQNLSSTVNVNAAGSVVPIQLNLGMLINSTVKNFVLSNGMTLSGYTP